MSKSKLIKMKLQTPVEIRAGRVEISPSDRIMVLGSCFADNIGQRMKNIGMDVFVNPFGTLYNPASVSEAVERLSSGRPFDTSECRMMGSGAGLVCSFSHHTSFARRTETEFLAHANAVLSEASEFFRSCNRLIITLGTSWCYRHIGDDRIVSNCLKRDAKEFARIRLSVDDSVSLLENIAAHCCPDSLPDGAPGKSIIFTVSPIRHLRDGAHENQLSKAALLLFTDRLCRTFPDRCDYFPAYEIVLDELRDYRFYDTDMAHPSSQAVDYVWERFSEAYFDENTRAVNREWVRLLQALRHRPLTPDRETYRKFVVQNILKLENFRKKYAFFDVTEELTAARQLLATLETDEI